MMHYEEESKGLGIYKMARALSRDRSPSSKETAQVPPTNIIYIFNVIDSLGNYIFIDVYYSPIPSPGKMGPTVIE